MKLTVSHLSDTGATADIVITYGTQVETYRKVAIDTLYNQSPTQPGRLANSALVTVPTAPSPPPTSYLTSPPQAGAPIPLIYDSPLDASHQSIEPQKIRAVFTENLPLDKVLFSLLVIPGITDAEGLAEGVAYAERKRAFYIMGSPPNRDMDQPTSSPEYPVNALLVLPCRSAPTPPSTTRDCRPPTSSRTALPTPSRTPRPPRRREASWPAYTPEKTPPGGVWKSPAGPETTLNGTLGVVPTGVMTDDQQGALNQVGINCLRVFPPLTPVVWGARTLAYRDLALRDQWGYIAVWRMALFLEQSLYQSLTWAVFEPNAALLNPLTGAAHTAHMTLRLPDDLAPVAIRGATGRRYIATPPLSGRHHRGVTVASACHVL
jgi:hypothetical protein